MVYVQLNPTLNVHNSWYSRKPDTEWTDLSGDKNPCLLHGYVVSHIVKQASSQWRKHQHEGGNTVPSKLHLHADITTWSPKLFLFLHCWQTPEVLLTGDILGKLSMAKLGSEILSWKCWPAWADFVESSPLSCIFQNKKWGRGGLESTVGLQSYFPLISKPYGWISWNSWGSTLHLAVFNRRNTQ